MNNTTRRWANPSTLSALVCGLALLAAATAAQAQPVPGTQNGPYTTGTFIGYGAGYGTSTDTIGGTTFNFTPTILGGAPSYTDDLSHAAQPGPTNGTWGNWSGETSTFHAAILSPLGGANNPVPNDTINPYNAGVTQYGYTGSGKANATDNYVNENASAGNTDYAAAFVNSVYTNAYGGTGTGTYASLLTAQATSNGFVAYDLRMSQTEVSANQWNAYVTATGGPVTTNVYPLADYNSTSAPYTYTGAIAGITGKTPDAAGTGYATVNLGNGSTSALTNVSLYQAMQFVNWLNTSTGHHAAYNFVPDPNNPAALVWVPWPAGQGALNSNAGWSQDPSGNAFTNFMLNSRATMATAANPTGAAYFIPSATEFTKAGGWNAAPLEAQTSATGSPVNPPDPSLAMQQSQSEVGMVLGSTGLEGTSGGTASISLLVPESGTSGNPPHTYWNLTTGGAAGGPNPFTGTMTQYAANHSSLGYGVWPVGNSPQELNGTYDMMGNAEEWTETTGQAFGPNNMQTMGGSFSNHNGGNNDANGWYVGLKMNSKHGYSSTSDAISEAPEGQKPDIGFRIASVGDLSLINPAVVPEPGSLALLAAFGVTAFLYRRRKRQA